MSSIFKCEVCESLLTRHQVNTGCPSCGTGTIEEIHTSLINGQKKQMTAQIKAYGEFYFFENYRDYLFNNCGMGGDFFPEEANKYFQDCVIAYMRLR